MDKRHENGAVVNLRTLFEHRSRMETTLNPHYIGRFAPSPTGPLHFGSLVAAVGSYLDARTHGGRWLVRIEDVDTQRAVTGSADNILATLRRFGFEWDGEVMRQSQRLAAYRDALAYLRECEMVYPCSCSRREIADSSLARDGSRLYPGTCRNGLQPGHTARAWRLRVAGLLDFEDAVQGYQYEDLEHEAGDFVVFRADGQFAYQLAVVVDDAASGVTHVVRGADLLDSTARQIFLQRLLGYPTPVHAHLPVAVNAAGEKLSKQTGATAIDDLPAEAMLLAALTFLGQIPPAELHNAPLTQIWQWALLHWSIDHVPARRELLTDDLPVKYGTQPPYHDGTHADTNEVAEMAQP